MRLKMIKWILFYMGLSRLNCQEVLSAIFDDILLQVFPLSCSSCPSQSSAPTGRPQHHRGLGLLGSPQLSRRSQLARPSEAQKADWARARPRRRNRVEYEQSFSQAGTGKRILITCSLWRSEKNTSAGENISCRTNYD